MQESDSKKIEQENQKDARLELRFSRRKISFGQIIIIIALALFAGFIAKVAIWEHNYIERMEGSERYSSDSSFIEGENIDYTEPTIADIDNYTVAPDKPRYLSIPSLGIITARIEEISILDSGELATPSNIYNVGWWNLSGLPGSSQVSMMDAHGGALGNGIFRNLPQISEGSEILIEMGNGRQYTYVVYDTATKLNGDEANSYMSIAETSPTENTGSLTLITCTGDWSLREQTYSHRFFVRALLKN